ncbi:hypothetical protein [Anaerosporobacter sp.]
MMKNKLRKSIFAFCAVAGILGATASYSAVPAFASESDTISATDGTTGKARLAYGASTVYGTTSTGAAYTETYTYSGNATRLTAKVSTFYTDGTGPSSTTSSASDASSVLSNTVVCSKTSGRRAVGYGTITYNGLTQTASPEVYY